MLNYVQVGLALAIVLLSGLAPVRREDRWTLWGWALLVVAVLSFAFAIVQVHNQAKERENAPFRFATSSLQLTLQAFYLSSLGDDSAFLANSPPEIEVRSARLGNYQLDFELTRIQDVFRPVSSRMTPPAQVTYVARQIRPSVADYRALSFEYLWDLDGDTLSFDLPVRRFRPLMPGREWMLSATVVIGDHAFRREADAKGKVAIHLAGLSEPELKSPTKAP